MRYINRITMKLNVAIKNYLIIEFYESFWIFWEHYYTRSIDFFDVLEIPNTKYLNNI